MQIQGTNGHKQETALARQLTDDQLRTRINRLMGVAGGNIKGPASAVKPMEPCNLGMGIDKVKRWKNFQDWS